MNELTRHGKKMKIALIYCPGSPPVPDRSLPTYLYNIWAQTNGNIYLNYNLMKSGPNEDVSNIKIWIFLTIHQGFGLEARVTGSCNTMEIMDVNCTWHTTSTPDRAQQYPIKTSLLESKMQLFDVNE